MLAWSCERRTGEFWIGAILKCGKPAISERCRPPRACRLAYCAPAGGRQVSLAFRAELVKGVPPQRLREQVALLVAEENGCVYCVSAHTFRGQKLGIDADELLANRRAASADPKMTAALAFARSLLTEKGKVSDALLADTRAAGWDDRALAEIAACGYP
ncbi:carboxymuconolactone decarboxylase family protein [Rhizobium sp. LjRoot30]|uniref:carboxymuconolactone decarboxylase family protein n=1 Tax=Rhizobium sp. LjRoot30 TaxID=3342320 RepID=UPI003F508ED9